MQLTFGSASIFNWWTHRCLKNKQTKKKNNKDFHQLQLLFLVSESVWLSVGTSYVPDDRFSTLLHHFFFYTLIIDSVPPLSSVSLYTAADFSHNQCRLLLLSLKIFCCVKCSEIAVASGEDKVTLTAGLLILHAEQLIKQPVAQRSSVVYDVYFVL